MAGTNPYTLANLTGGVSRVLIAPMSVAVPTGLDDIFSQLSPYDPITGWVDLGATSGPSSVDRALTTGGFAIEQSNDVLLEEVTNLIRTVKVAIAELRSDTLALLEEGTTGALTAAASVLGVGGGSRE